MARKRIRMVVEVSCPDWMTTSQARREVRSLINEGAHYGHRKLGTFDEADQTNFRAISIKPGGF